MIKLIIFYYLKVFRQVMILHDIRTYDIRRPSLLLYFKSIVFNLLQTDLFFFSLIETNYDLINIISRWRYDF